ncbi:E3 ubiquitin-protein ligase NRDP1-like [Oppia nitens]|uniref:E3 ubiquitin-protein ligase NRDP1-like n=1 Tax=Oppia nitens TaxID=1686743 RepID=UPI0023DB43F0|nr:E3 ubiquitin-protein ligase NRDP1-like [Oppia nitens]
MGYEIERFISEISDNLICKLCHKVYDNPKSLTSCDHIFCFSCIEKIVINENCCPLDHTLIESSCIEEAPPFILDYLSVMKIKCDFSEHGCRESVPLNRLLLHRLNCEFHPERKIKCTNCEVDVEKYRLSDHNCINLLKNKIDFLSDQINDLKNYYNNELSSLRCRLEN